MKILSLVLVLTLPLVSVHAQTVGATFPESMITAPDKDATNNNIDYNIYSIYRNDYSVDIGSQDKLVKGFGFINNGGNTTVVKPEPMPGDGPVRYYDFSFKDRARQDMHMAIGDCADAVVANNRESVFYFFPRLVLPAITVSPDNSNIFIVTLPTKETVQFDRASKIVLSGVLSEDQPLDMNPNGNNRKFAAISYSGKGLYLRADKRADSPQNAKTVTAVYQNKKCQIPGKDVFNQDPNGAMTFRFATDAQFNKYLQAKCNFQIPNL